MRHRGRCPTIAGYVPGWVSKPEPNWPDHSRAYFVQFDVVSVSVHPMMRQAKSGMRYFIEVPRCTR